MKIDIYSILLKFILYLFTGLVMVVVYILLGLISDNFRVVFNMTLIILGITFLGFCVYEGSRWVYKIVKKL